MAIASTRITLFSIDQGDVKSISSIAGIFIAKTYMPQQPSSQGPQLSFSANQHKTKYSIKKATPHLLRIELFILLSPNSISGCLNIIINIGVTAYCPFRIITLYLQELEVHFF